MPWPSNAARTTAPPISVCVLGRSLKTNQTQIGARTVSSRSIRLTSAAEIYFGAIVINPKESGMISNPITTANPICSGANASDYAPTSPAAALQSPDSPTAGVMSIGRAARTMLK